MAKKKASAKTQPPQSFEASLASLEQIVGRLESGDLGLEQSLDAYEQGIQRLKECHRHLQAAQRRVERLSGFDAEGNPVLEPLDDTPTATRDAEAEGQAETARTKTRAARRKTDLEDDLGLF
ncbi:exodeoxyribonuclease VII small subunit [Roseimaritima sediminicola]|uniref:exodeoxyribonuclease VII small subunit n=1 Tax=Roseimaritima sediminicola TaxID=2662066 RepID=UPI0036F32CFC